jgi:hypothetical protein
MAVAGPAARADRCFECGLLAGCAQAALFNPWDRALYLAHLNKRRFLDRRNFARPYEGFHQSIFHRVISGGMYFPAEEKVRELLPEAGLGGPNVRNMTAGVIAGCSIAVTTNPLAAIKYQSWGTSHEGRMLQTAKDMLLRGGPAVFFRAIHITVVRDTVWGGSYALLRNWLPRALKGDALTEQDLRPGPLSFACNSVAGGIATSMSSPLNYVRNIQYGTNVAIDAKSALVILQQLARDCKASVALTGESPARFLVHRLAIGWGTLRVALGLGVTSQIYGACTAYFAVACQ